MKKVNKKMVLLISCFWLVGSLLGSWIKQFSYHDFATHEEVNNCGKTYPIDYFFYNNLFCEV